jgi:hypothetical protein
MTSWCQNRLTVTGLREDIGGFSRNCLSFPEGAGTGATACRSVIYRSRRAGNGLISETENSKKVLRK